ncbi:MAG: phenylalanine--tRNA ligase subunit alpha [Deltaproteobacteria bacterium]|nr:phenylalanine--tRNA ligase subunit alpha [Deltaproteobacteria bacterium]
MEQDLLKLQAEALARLTQAKAREEVDTLRIQYLGRKGFLAAIMKRLGELPKEERPRLGQVANQVKAAMEEAMAQAVTRIESIETAQAKERSAGLDLTLPGRRPKRGRLHPITQTFREVCDIFIRLGFEIVDGPEVELDYYNFEALNIPKDHPARDMQDTFYVSEDVVLRTHTSPMQVRVMEKTPPPVKIIAPGKVFRRDSDVTHTPMFHQVEGLMVGDGVSFGDLKGILTTFVHQMYGEDTAVRFRPSFFPFTEPSAEVDIQCVLCRGAGCRLCGQTGWLEILGSGMVHPALYGYVKNGYDTGAVTGFAFGMGVERIAMLKYGVDDIRSFYENDVRFLNQF